MAVVSIRVEDEVLALLRAHDVNVSEVARTALADKARRIRALEALRWLQVNQLPPGPEPSEVVIRRLRDERSVRP